MHEVETRSIHINNSTSETIHPHHFIQHNDAIYYRVSSFRRAMVYITGMALAGFNFYLSRDTNMTYEIVSCVSGFLFFVSARYL